MGKKRRRGSQSFAELPEGCHHYEDLAEVPWDIQKYAPGVVLPGTAAYLYKDTTISATRSSQDMMKAFG